MAAYELFCEHYPHGAPVHMVGVTVSGFDYHVQQLSLGELTGENEGYARRERAETAVSNIRKKYGYAMLQRGIVLEDQSLNGLDIRGKKHAATQMIVNDEQEEK